ESGPSAEALAVATLALHEARRSEQRPLPALEPGFRNNRFQREWVELEHAGDVTRVEYQNRGGGELTITVGDTELSCRALAWSAAEHLLRYEFTLGESAPMRRSARVRMRGEQVFVAGVAGSAAFSVVPRFKRAEAEVEAGACIAPMPGKVVKLLAETGKVVEAGQVLVILEAMKMEHSVKAAEAGVVKEVRVAEGDQVEDASVLVVVGPADAD
ncbi:MAG: biotin/lipoyl-binding protein, partial [Myxococcales bacterium]|nr:biotin/lipoyl-binding protein [Myxococcales bacterium]